QPGQDVASRISDAASELCATPPEQHRQIAVSESRLVDRSGGQLGSPVDAVISAACRYIPSESAAAAEPVNVISPLPENSIPEGILIVDLDIAARAQFRIVERSGKYSLWECHSELLPADQDVPVVRLIGSLADGPEIVEREGREGCQHLGGGVVG